MKIKIILSAILAVFVLSSCDKDKLIDITTETVFRYQDAIDNAYRLTVDGSLLCDINEDVAEDKFEQVESILNAIDEVLKIEPKEVTEQGE